MLVSTSELYRYIKRTCHGSSLGGTPSGESTRRQTYRYSEAYALPNALSLALNPLLDSRELGQPPSA